MAAWCSMATISSVALLCSYATGRKGPCYVDITGNGVRPCCVDITGNGFSPCCVNMQQVMKWPLLCSYATSDGFSPCCVHNEKDEKAPAVFILKKRKGPCCVHIKKTEKHKILSTVFILLLRWNVIKITDSQLEYPNTTPLVLFPT